MSFDGLTKVRALCTGIQRSSGRARLQQIFTGYSGNKPTIGLNYEHVPYHWRIERAQFLAPLLLDQEKERIAEMPHGNRRTTQLSEETQQFLRATHNQILMFNIECVEPLLTHIPNACKALNPYTDKLDLICDDIKHDINPLNSDILSSSAIQFQSHPAIRYLVSQPQQMQHLSPEIIEDEVRKMEQSWRGVGAMHTVNDQDDFLRQTSSHSLCRKNLGFFAVITCLRAMLRVTNQLIYQSVLADKPAILDIDNVFALKFSFHTTGKGVDLQFQPNNLSGRVPKRGDILLLQAIPNYGLTESSLCEVETEGFHLGPQTGTIQHPQMRILDDNLCPFNSCWKRIFDIR